MTLFRKLSDFSVIIFLLTFAGQTVAQTSVTLYGRIAGEVNYQTNVNTGRVDGNGKAITGNQWNMPGNIWGTSIIGVKGTEYLGGGLTALFVLESGFAPGYGEVNEVGVLWNRSSFVGLSGQSGTLKLGRDLTLPSDMLYSLDPTGQQAMSTATLAKGRNWPQTNNQIQYISPEINGFSVIGVYGFGGVAGSMQSGSSNGVEVGYEKNGVLVRVMLDSAYDSSGKLSSLFQYSREITVGGALTFDKWKVFAGYQTQYAPDMVASFGHPDKAQQFWLGAQYKISPNLLLIPAVFHSKLNQNTGRATLAMLGANYSLSKNTVLFASVGTLRNSEYSSFAIEVGTNAVGVNQSAFYTGVSQSF